ncbi:MAG: S1 RNA-binding domain-containing protein [Phycisphaeraceae bacterium]|nr:S1 RNA-binding domain-containing protein [Phycisphaeraceae bacterium]
MTQSPNPAGEPVRSDIDAELDREINEALGGQSLESLMAQSEPDGGQREAGEAEGQDEPGKAGDASGGGGAGVVGQLKRGRITAISGDDVFVDLAGMPGKNQGVVPLTQFERPPRVGSIMDFVVQRYDDSDGLVVLSREGAAARATWEQIQKGLTVEARVTGTNKGGLELEVTGGIRAFMPASQVDLHHTDDLQALVGQKLEAIVQDVDRRGKSVVLSRRALLEKRRESMRKKLWETIEAGAILDGVVTRIAEFGAFVDIGGVEGLVHVSDMAYSRVDKPESVVSAGQKVQVKVLKLDEEKQRISLGLKQVQPDPWATLGERIKPGDQISGRVMRLAPFGAFIEVEAGVEGLAPLSELSWTRISRADQAVKEGDIIRVAVLSVDIPNHRVSLSVRQTSGDPWVGAEHKYAKHSLVEGTVLSTTDFGAFVQLEPGVEGLVHISELSDKRVGAVTDVVSAGQKHQFRVLDVDEDNHKIRLSLKAVNAPPAPEGETTTSAAHAGGRPSSGHGGSHRGERVVTAPARPAAKRPGKPLKGGLE